MKKQILRHRRISCPDRCRRRVNGQQWRAGVIACVIVLYWLAVQFSPILRSHAYCATCCSLTHEEERQLGRQFLVHVKEQLTLIDDSIIIDYVTKVGRRIEKDCPDSAFTYHFYVVKEETYNAFAAPAGHVFINSGLFAAMQSENELAGILGHEMAHVSCRHISKQIERSGKIGMATLAGMLAGIFLGGGGEVASAITIGSIAAGQSLQLKYSREHEAEADHVGMRCLVRSGYGADGLRNILRKIRTVRWFGPNEIPTYLTTHPAVEDRLAYIDTQTQNHPEWAQPSRKIDPYDFNKAHTRLIALYGDADVAQRRFTAALAENPDNCLAYYGLALVSERKDQRESALNLFNKAISCNPADPDILLDIGQSYFLAGDYEKAMSILKGALAFRPKDRKGYFLLGRCFLETGNPHDAIEELRRLVSLDPDFTEAYFHLGNAYDKTGNSGEAHYNLGVYFEQKRDRKNARYHFKQASELLKGDPERIEALRKRIKSLGGN
ncbi:MAG: hypothetical protein BA868_09465 [Desulfobacterales bacterium C00003106]|nr:MAG: hypothetical protein BA868_09465 [Desulfobacterales bacterium C00003106]